MPIDVTKPADDDFLNVSAAHIRANFQATKEAIGPMPTPRRH